MFEEFQGIQGVNSSTEAQLHAEVGNPGKRPQDDAVIAVSPGRDFLHKAPPSPHNVCVTIRHEQEPCRGRGGEQGRPRCDKHGSQVCQKYNISGNSEAAKRLFQSGYTRDRTGDLSQGAFGQCEAKIIPLDHVPCLWMSRLTPWLLLSNRSGVSQPVRSGPAARRHPLPPAAAGLRPRKC